MQSGKKDNKGRGDDSREDEKDSRRERNNNREDRRDSRDTEQRQQSGKKIAEWRGEVGGERKTPAEEGREASVVVLAFVIVVVVVCLFFFCVCFPPALSIGVDIFFVRFSCFLFSCN